MLLRCDKAAINPLNKVLGNLFGEIMHKIQIAVKNVSSSAIIRKSVYKEVLKFFQR